MSAIEIEERAALWIVRREERDWSAEDESALSVWLNESMAHRAAFWRLEHGWKQADRVPALGGSGMIEEPVLSRRRFPPMPVWAKVTGITALAASMVLAFGGVLRTTGNVPAPHSTEVAYQTVRGDRGTIRLADGSKVDLNTATSLRASSGTNTREVWLDQGEAFFDVVHKPDRRFIVHAGARDVVVLGTRFSVRRDGDRVTVGVLSGRVRVEDAATHASGRVEILSRGNVAVSRSDATLVTNPGVEKMQTMTAWRDGMLVFDGTPLSDAVAEFNRYSRLPIRISDPELRRIRIGGSFRTSSSDAFLELLQSAYGLHVEREMTEVKLQR